MSALPESQVLLSVDGRRGLRAALWPTPSPRDSELLRRKMFVVRAAHVAVAFLVAVAVIGTGATHFGQISIARLIALAAAGVAYIAWSLYGTADAARFILWRELPREVWPVRSAGRSVIQIAIAFALAEAIVWLAAPGGVLGLLWIVLLPPIGYAVIFHGPRGIVATSLCAVALQTLNVVHWYGWTPVPVAISGFCVAVLFTLVFTLIAVSAERARAEVERLADELRDANGRLREYALQAEELAATRERNQMAREIHDSLGHCLTVVHVQLQAARATFDDDKAGALDALAKAQSMTHEGLQEIRRSVSSLRTSPLRDRPIDEALRQLVSDGRAAGPAKDLVVLGGVRAVSPQVALTLYRAAQEGLTNARKHAGAKTVRVELDFRRAEIVRLAVIDDGAGVSGDVVDGFGVIGLRERALLLGGRTAIHTGAGKGFTLEVEVPG